MTLLYSSVVEMWCNMHWIAFHYVFLIDSCSRPYSVFHCQFFAHDVVHILTIQTIVFSATAAVEHSQQCNAFRLVIFVFRASLVVTTVYQYSVTLIFCLTNILCFRFYFIDLERYYFLSFTLLIYCFYFDLIDLCWIICWCDLGHVLSVYWF